LILIVSSRTKFYNHYIVLVANYAMESFINKIYTAFPKNKAIAPVDETVYTHWNFQNFQDSKYINILADRSDLYALSIMIENYAAKHSRPLVAAFEDEARYKYVEGRYMKLMKSLPKIWIIGNFNNPYLAQTIPPHATVVSCVGTSLKTVWMVVTRDENGPVGLVAEDVGEGKFSGFFSTENAIVKYAIDMAAYELKTEIDVMKKEWTQSPGGY